MALNVQVEALIGVYDLHEISEMEQDNKERAGRNKKSYNYSLFRNHLQTIS